MIYFPEQQKNTSQQNWYSALPAEIQTSFWGQVRDLDQIPCPNVPNDVC